MYSAWRKKKDKKKNLVSNFNSLIEERKKKKERECKLMGTVLFLKNKNSAILSWTRFSL